MYNVNELNELDTLLPRGPTPKTAMFLVAMLVILGGGMFVRIAYADDVPKDILDWINSNGTKGSPVHVDSGNITLMGTSNTSLVHLGNSSGQAGSNPAGASNITNSTVVGNETQNVTSNNNQTQNVTLVYVNSTLSEQQTILEKSPIVSVYAGENYTIYVQDNKQSSAWFRWLMASIMKR